MQIINRSRKIIGINGEPVLPGASVNLPEGAENNPAIAYYLEKGIVVDAKKDIQSGTSAGISDFERAKIAEEAVAEYKKQQEEAAAQAEKEKQDAKEAEIRAVHSMKKPELLTKAAGMGLDVKDDDKVEDLREKIITAINQ